MNVQNIEVIENRYKNAMKLLEKISKGTLPVVDGTALSTDNRRVWSKTDGIRPVFDLDDETKWGVDADELDTIEEERDAADSMLPESH